MKVRRFSRALVTAAVSALLVSTLVAAGAGTGDNEHQQQAQYRWDIVSLDAVAKTISAGGKAMATAQDGSSISLTGRGTFLADSRTGNRQVTGGGTWSTTSETGAVTGAGTYQVISFVQFAVAPGAAAAGLTDLIAAPSTTRAGLLNVTIRYSNGATGVLIVSCHIPGPPAAPESIFEGVRASMGFVDFWNGVQPAPPPSNSNRTLFEVAAVKITILSSASPSVRTSQSTATGPTAGCSTILWSSRCAPTTPDAHSSAERRLPLFRVWTSPRRRLSSGKRPVARRRSETTADCTASPANEVMGQCDS